MNPHIITEDKLKELLQYAYDYGRSCQFNYGLFGPACKQAEHFTLEKATQYCLDQLNSNK